MTVYINKQFRPNDPWGGGNRFAVEFGQQGAVPLTGRTGCFLPGDMVILHVTGDDGCPRGKEFFAEPRWNIKWEQTDAGWVGSFPPGTTAKEQQDTVDWINQAGGTARLV